MIELFYYDNGLKKGDIKDIAKLKSKQLWIDITDISKKEEDLIKNSFSLHPLTAEDLLASNTRIKVEEFDSRIKGIESTLEMFSKRYARQEDLKEMKYIIDNINPLEYTTVDQVKKMLKDDKNDK